MKKDSKSFNLPEKCPQCVVRILDRPEWFEIPGIVASARVAEVKGFSRLLSSKKLAKEEIGAIALGSTIYFRRPELYNPHTVAGIAFLAHELKHVEQYKRDGLLMFIARYVWDFIVHRGYSEKLRYEAEASEFQRQVAAHLSREFSNNSGSHPCKEKGEPHSVNEHYLVEKPAAFQYRV